MASSDFSSWFNKYQKKYEEFHFHSNFSQQDTSNILKGLAAICFTQGYKLEDIAGKGGEGISYKVKDKEGQLKCIKGFRGYKSQRFLQKTQETIQKTRKKEKGLNPRTKKSIICTPEEVFFISERNINLLDTKLNPDAIKQTKPEDNSLVFYEFPFHQDLIKGASFSYMGSLIQSGQGTFRNIKKIYHALIHFSTLVNLVADLHTNGIHHGDISPNNISINSGLKLYDFNFQPRFMRVGHTMNLHSEVYSAYEETNPEYYLDPKFDTTKARQQHDLAQLGQLFGFLFGGKNEPDIIESVPEEFYQKLPGLKRDLTVYFPKYINLPTELQPFYERFNTEEPSLQEVTRDLFHLIIKYKKENNIK